MENKGKVDKVEVDKKIEAVEAVGASIRAFNVEFMKKYPNFKIPKFEVSLIPKDESQPRISS